MFKTIIVAVDARQGGRDALALAAQLARTFGAEIAMNAYRSGCFTRRRSDVTDAVEHEPALTTVIRLKSCQWPRIPTV